MLLETICMNDDNDALWFDKHDFEAMNVLDINYPNDNDVTIMPVIKDKEWIRSPWSFHLTLI